MRRGLRLTFNAPVTLWFVFFCCAATFLGPFTGGKTDEMLFMTYHSSLSDPLTFVRFFTHVMGHSGWEHFISNASYLLLLGPMLEEKHGSSRILGVILITALITGLVNYFFFPAVALRGASSVVFAFILLTSFTGFREGEIPVSFLLVAAIFLGQQVYEGLVLNDDVSNLSHIIGGLVGAVLGYELNKRGRR